MNERIRVLFLAANPEDVSQLRLNEEAREITERIQLGSNRDSFELFFYPALRAEDLQRLLMRHKPQIVHFSGHGNLADQIVREGVSNNENLVGTDTLVDIFRLFRDHVRVIVLNTGLARSMAKELAEVVDYVIGISKAIGDRAAISFAGGFYQALAFGMPVQEAFASAVAELKLQNVRQSSLPELLIRLGANFDEPLLLTEAKASTQSKQQLTDALQKVLDGSSTADDAHRVRLASLDGSLILEPVEDLVEGEANVLEVSGVKGAWKGLRAQLHSASYNAVQERIFPPLPGIGPPLPGMIVVGRESALSDVKALLGVTETGSSVDAKTVILRGWPGSGKTTLVGVLGRDPEVLKTFPDGVLWTALDRHPELMIRMAEWGRALGTDDLLRTPTLKQAVENLAVLLRHRRMLLIVDGVWEAADAVPFLKAAAKTKCATLITTRLSSVAEALTNNPENIYVLPVLTEDDALALLRYLSPSSVEHYPNECRELVRDLECLPLALHVAGRMLRTAPKTELTIVDLIEEIREGARILEESAPVDRTEGTLLPTVQALFKQSTDELDESSRECFAYLAPFAPKPATFDAAAMKAVWHLDDPMPMIQKLVGKGLLEPTGNGRFQIHALLVRHARSLLS